MVFILSLFCLSSVSVYIAALRAGMAAKRWALAAFRISFSIDPACDALRIKICNLDGLKGLFVKQLRLFSEQNVASVAFQNHFF